MIVWGGLGFPQNTIALALFRSSKWHYIFLCWRQTSGDTQVSQVPRCLESGFCVRTHLSARVRTQEVEGSNRPEVCRAYRMAELRGGLG